MYYKTWQPGFEGFYNSRYSFDFDDIHWKLFNDPDNVNDEHLKWLLENVDDYIDYKKYATDVSKLYMETWFELAEVDDFVRNVKFEYLHSPKEFNFSTDSINIQVNLNLKKLVDACKNHCDFSEYIKQTYTSYDGFISSYSSLSDIWLETVKQDSAHKIGAMLAFLGAVDPSTAVDENEIFDRIQNEVYQMDYINYDDFIEAFNDKFETEITDLEMLENFDAPYELTKPEK